MKKNINDFSSHEILTEEQMKEKIISFLDLWYCPICYNFNSKKYNRCNKCNESNAESNIN